MNFLSEIIGSLAGTACLTIFLAIPIILIGLITYIPKKNSKMVKHINYSSFLLLLGGLILTINTAGYLVSLFTKSSSSSESVADGYTIDSYNVKLNVNENSVVDVTEIITVNFYEEGHHGIYKFVPSWLEYTGKDGKTISRESLVENLQAVGDEYSLDTVKGKDRIKIGSSNYTLTTGLKTYTITYQYNMGQDPFEGFDEFIFHIFGDYWGTTINNASVEITMPKTFDENSIKFFTDKYRNNDVTSSVDFYIVGNTLYARASSLKLQKSLTVDIELPEGYFVGAESTYGSISLVLCLIIIMFAIIAFIKWLKHGKDYNNFSETVEFYPPEGYDSATIGYIYKKDTGRKLAIAIIVQLASKGFIRIDESEDKKVRTITNLCSTDVNKAINRQIIVTKLKDATKKSDIKLMNELFQKSTTATINDDFDNFYKKTKKLVSNECIKIVSDSINDYTSDEISNMANQIKEKAFAGKPQMTSNEQLVFDQLFANGDTNILSEDREFYKVFGKISENLQNEFQDKINDVNSYKHMAITSLLFYIGSIYFIFSFSIIKDLNPKFKILYLIAFIALIVIFIFAILMKRKNNYGEKIMAKIKGFKNYLETAEKDQINSLVNDNPNYFYDILPYAYVLGVSKTWIEKFEKIPMPENDMGNFDYCNMDSFNSLSDSVYLPHYSSNSSCGGGCSSCGGGCSSCGGGGSW